MRVLKLALLPLLLLLGGCDFEALVDRVIPDEARPVIDDVHQAIIEGDLALMESVLHRDFPIDDVPREFEQFLAELPEGEPGRIQLASASHNTTTSTSGRQSTLVVQYVLHWEERSIAVTTTMRKSEDGAFASDWVVWHLNALEIEAAPPGPALSEASPSQQVFAGLAMFMPVFILFTFFATFRFKRLKRRILWPIFILLGFPVFAMDWSTGQMWLDSPGFNVTDSGFHVDLFSFKLLGAAIFREGAGAPWVVYVAVPIGALLFWYRVMRGGPTRKPVTPEQRI